MFLTVCGDKLSPACHTSYGGGPNAKLARSQKAHTGDLKSSDGCSAVLQLWRARKVFAFIEENLEQRISTSTLARQAGLSLGHFSTAFKNTVGKTPQAYVMEQRLLRAKSMLFDEIDVALSDVAACCGFTDQAHLNNRFKATFGLSPGAWRKENSCLH